MNDDQPTAIPTPKPWRMSYESSFLLCKEIHGGEDVSSVMVCSGTKHVEAAVALGIVTPPLARDAPPPGWVPTWMVLVQEYGLAKETAQKCVSILADFWTKWNAAREAETLTDRNEEGERRPAASVNASRTAGDEDDIHALLQARLERSEKLLRENPGHDPVSMGVRAIAAARIVLIEEIANTYNIMRGRGEDAATSLALFAQRDYIRRLEALVMDGGGDAQRCDGCGLVFDGDAGEHGEDCWLCGECVAAARAETAS